MEMLDSRKRKHTGWLEKESKESGVDSSESHV